MQSLIHKETVHRVRQFLISHGFKQSKLRRHRWISPDVVVESPQGILIAVEVINSKNGIDLERQLEVYRESYDMTVIIFAPSLSDFQIQERLSIPIVSSLPNIRHHEIEEKLLSLLEPSIPESNESEGTHPPFSDKLQEEDVPATHQASPSEDTEKLHSDTDSGLDSSSKYKD